jgi:hypothetical protein
LKLACDSAVSSRSTLRAQTHRPDLFHDAPTNRRSTNLLELLLNALQTIAATDEPNRIAPVPRLFGTAFALAYFDLRDKCRSRMLGACRSSNMKSVNGLARKTSRA